MNTCGIYHILWSILCIVYCVTIVEWAGAVVLILFLVIIVQQAGASPDAADTWLGNVTALHCAAARGHLRAVRELLRQGAWCLLRVACCSLRVAC
jgi:hypothetical protein